MEEPLLSIVTITYNHEPYIRKCIEGVLMQQVNFPIEFILAEDCSTDGTLAICKEYAEKYPDLIKLITSENNVGAIANERRAMKAAKGKYIAFCEGDDYWTDPYKLRKQVDFMESNPDCSVTFHRYKIYDEEVNKWREDQCSIYLREQHECVQISIKDFLNVWVTQPVTMMFRTNIDLGSSIPYRFRRDQHLIYHLLKVGNGYILNLDAAVYREHQSGIHSKTSQIDQCEVGVIIASELYKYNGTNILKNNYINNLDWAIDIFIKYKVKKWMCLKYIFNRFWLSFSFTRLTRHLIKHMRQ